MKRYKVQYYYGSSKPDWFAEISESGILIGVRIIILKNGLKICQDKCKNDLMNGIEKNWERNSKNWCFQNWNKENEQGIKIKFKI